MSEALYKTYMVSFDISSTGERLNVLVLANNREDAKTRAEQKAKHISHYGVCGSYKVDRDWRNP